MNEIEMVSQQYMPLSSIIPKDFSVITNDLFKLCFSRVASGMLHNDHLTLAVLLARIRLRGMSSESMYEQEFQYMLRSKEGVNWTHPHLQVPPFQNLERIIGGKEFQAWLESPTPEMSVPVAWETEKPLTPVGTAMYSLLLIQAFRPDRFRAATAFLC
ncbi:hypothetical protein Avbf_18584 [Armadillidium vulgare]|nr:hypothetical protein Avbf_18584 [Armadillidium vulgare]